MATPVNTAIGTIELVFVNLFHATEQAIQIFERRAKNVNGSFRKLAFLYPLTIKTSIVFGSRILFLSFYFWYKT